MNFILEGTVHSGNKGYSGIRGSGTTGAPVILERHSLHPRGAQSSQEVDEENQMGPLRLEMV